MGNLLTSLLNSTGALRTYGLVFDVIQNNISNANTPGYVKQNQDVIALPFQPNGGPAGGVLAGPLLSSRNRYLEQTVRDDQQLLGAAQQKASDLGQIEPLFSLSSDAGIPNALNHFFGSFSQLSVTPNDTVLRQQVITQAQNVATSFQQVSRGIQTTSSNIDQSIRDTVAKINSVADKIAAINSQNHDNAFQGQDPGLDAQLYSQLEDLASTANITLIPSSDGTFNLYVGSQTPLVIANKSFHVSADFSSVQTAILDSSGNDITSQITGGELAGELQDRNTTLPGYQSSLNNLAQTFADQVNTALAQGVDQNGVAPTTNLFTYNTATDAATTLGVSNLTPDQIAAASANAPGGGGNAILLAQLANSQAVGGATFTQAYGTLGALVGNDVSKANDDQSHFQDLVVQARAQRTKATGVSLDEEAAKLLQFQQAYQAVGKLVSVLDGLAQSVLNMVSVP
jgi:flagellar hook-associated protein 1